MIEQMLTTYLNFTFTDRKCDVVEYGEHAGSIYIHYLYKYKEGEYKDISHRDNTTVSTLELLAWFYTNRQYL